MEDLTPQDAMIIVGFALTVTIGSILYSARESIWRAVSRIFSRYMSTSSVPAGGQNLADTDRFDTVSPAKRNGEMVKYGVAMGKSAEAEDFDFPDNFAVLARLVSDRTLTETEAIALLGAKPGKSKKYRIARNRLHAALAELDSQVQPQYWDLNEERQPVLKER